MSKIFTAALVLLLLSCSKEPVPESACFTKSDPPRNSEKVTIEQGVWGDVWFWKGDFMPAGRGEICQVMRTVYIYELTTLSEVEKPDQSSFYSEINTRLVKTVNSDSKGFFQIELEPGAYSLFVMEGGKYYANLFESGGAIFPVRIESGQVVEVRFDITYQATF